MFRSVRFALVSLVSMLALAGTAHAAGGRYSFDGGNAYERAQVRQALNVSAFDWNVVPGRITIHIAPGIPNSEAMPGEIWLDANLLESGVFSWGIVQHEYAHEVDFLLLNDAQRTALGTQLGGRAWWQSDSTSYRHGELTSERFASTLAWAYWPSPQNSMKPHSKNDESAAMNPARFRGLMTQLIGVQPVQFVTAS
jgi:hypothetical protein